ncbi:DUF6602 domain-containing protein [Achromobacter xylosoxidans]|uniref:DUF6602 domain-containing protein n=1 Tax=Alcaligenes xylosoxydans xylosoxydans TaxID=85698 RepID=UPI001EEC57D7|nr:DUF6602 domain-containing protein [Achromobacter xylosoxidans]
MYSPNPQRPESIYDEDAPLVIPETYLKQVAYDEGSQRQLREERNKIKATSRANPDSAGERTEEVFAELVRKLIPDEFKVVPRARIELDDPRDSPQLDLVILKPGGEKRLNDLKSYPLSSVLAAFECKLTLRRSDLGKAAATANAIKGDYANGLASHLGSTHEEIGSCRPYFGIVALGWEKGDALSLVPQLADDLLNSFHDCPVGRQVDCVLVPELSFYSIVHEKDAVDDRICMGVRHEPIHTTYSWPDGSQRPWPPRDATGLEVVGYPSIKARFPQHNPLTGFAYFLACVVEEFSANYAHMTSRYAYYGQCLITRFRPHSPKSAQTVSPNAN